MNTDVLEAFNDSRFETVHRCLLYRLLIKLSQWKYQMCAFILSYLDGFSLLFILDSSVYVSAQFQTISGCLLRTSASLAAVKYEALLGKGEHGTT